LPDLEYISCFFFIGCCFGYVVYRRYYNNSAFSLHASSSCITVTLISYHFSYHTNIFIATVSEILKLIMLVTEFHWLIRYRITFVCYISVSVTFLCFCFCGRSIGNQIRQLNQVQSSNTSLFINILYQEKWFVSFFRYS